ncbi:MAG TPA: phosphoenolpyruvate carboxykinase (ATP) [Gemmataceae bacterium]|nr:phosphoenolpyruvate carboxykinase (ATP) [Gemmataceae bacterium]
MASPLTPAVADGAIGSGSDSSLDLRPHGLVNVGHVYANLSSPALTEQIISRQEALLTEMGAIAAYTGKYTGRSPQDRYIVQDDQTRELVDWGPVNRPMSQEAFASLLKKVQRHFEGKDLFVSDGWACADPHERLQVRLICEKGWHALFTRCLLLRPPTTELANLIPDLTIYAATSLNADPGKDGTRSGVFIVLNLTRGIVLIGGTEYAGEIKKAVFSVLNFLLPRRGVFPMHCSANIGRAREDTALFFGLSGTGKTTLSADPERQLIGDDEHGWSDRGVFNIEGGCYAKTIKLSKAGEPQIWNALRFGCVLENVVLDPLTRRPNFDDDRLTENTRGAYPVDFIDNCVPSGQGGHPANIIFLTCDAFGVLPPVSRLTAEQAMYHFLSGYTAKVAGTEVGLTSPQVTFSTCFASPFLPLPPPRYAQMLHDKLNQHKSLVWLVNTGWTEGPQGQGHRIPLDLTRAMVRAILDGALNKVSYTPHPIFRVNVPPSCPGVPAKVLQPELTWKDAAAYEAQARHLAGLFQKNFAAYAGGVSEAVRQAGPIV